MTHGQKNIKSYKRLLQWHFHPRQSGKNKYILKKSVK